MFRIGEFSKLVRVTPRMLRHWEKCGLLYPAEIDCITGYRRYSAAQIPMLLDIVALRDMDFSLNEIGDILPNMDDAAYMDKILMGKSMEIQTSIDAQKHTLKRLENARKNLRKRGETMKYEVVLKELPKVKVLSFRERIANYSKEGAMWEKLGAFMGTHRVSCPSVEENGYSIYYDEDYKESDVDVEIAVPVEAFGQSDGPFVYKELDEIPLAATLRFSGPYDGYAEAMGELASWIEENGYTIAGLVRGAAIRTAANQSDPQNFLTEIQIPVKKEENKP